MFDLEEILKLRNDDQYLKLRMDSMIDHLIEEDDSNRNNMKETVFKSAIMLSYIIQDADSLDEDELIETSNEIYYRYIKSIISEDDNSF